MRQAGSGPIVGRLDRDQTRSLLPIVDGRDCVRYGFEQDMAGPAARG
jgi:hypothetical protein